MAVDLSLGALPFEHEAVAQQSVVHVAGVRIPVPKVEDLIIMKAVAHREQDLLDIAGLLDLHAKIDVKRVKQVVGQFAEAMDAPEILDSIERRLATSLSSTARNLVQRQLRPMQAPA